MATLFLTRIYHYLTASTESKYWLVNFFPTFPLPIPPSSVVKQINCHIVWHYLLLLFKQLSENHQFKAELLRNSLKCFCFPNQLYSLRNAVMWMKLSSDPYHRQKLKKQPGAWASTNPGESLGYKVTGFTWVGTWSGLCVCVCVWVCTCSWAQNGQEGPKHTKKWLKSRKTSAIWVNFLPFQVQIIHIFNGRCAGVGIRTHA